MHIKGYIVVALLSAFVSWLVFSPDDDATERGKPESESGSGDIRRALPREPEPLPARERYGIAGMPAIPVYPDVAPYSDDGFGRPRSPRQGYRPREPWSDSMERFHFRPLTERERQRLETNRPVLDYLPNDQAASVPPWPYPQPQGPRNRLREPPGMASDPRLPFPPQRYDRNYSFRPEQQPATNRGHGIPYDRGGNRQWQRAPERIDPWHEPSSPQWGSTPPGWEPPPADRMYPNLDVYSDTKLTAAFTNRTAI